MFEQVRFAFIGPGVMAEAMAARLIKTAGIDPDRITMSGPREDRLNELKMAYQVRTVTDNVAAVHDADLIVLAVKPQTLPVVLEELHGKIPEDALLLSIVAGATCDDLSRGSLHDAIVRTMPNTPAQVGQGITVWTATTAVGEEKKDIARQTLSSFGDEVFVEKEEYLDMATALSGTGPAYVFLFMEAMVDAGVHLGFPRRIAEKLVVQTVKGSVAYYEDSPLHLARLRNKVTSPGGTSAAALYYLEKAGVRTAISRAIWAAYERSLELGRGEKSGLNA
ncbi:MAG: pyrroline-5-carboxylate reductase [Anaerolineales bacterium]|nr:pyrroline-5-carboxylate reductase [Anaerolineales bacterium]